MNLLSKKELKPINKTNHSYRQGTVLYSAFFCLWSFLIFFRLARLEAEHSEYIFANVSYAIHGAGNIINSSGEGLDLIERGINSGYLYSPQFTQIVESIGPIYRIPDFTLTAYTGGFSYFNRKQDVEYGFSIS